MRRDHARILIAALVVACLVGCPAAAPPTCAQTVAPFGFTPDRGPPGTLVKIVGAALDSVLAVYFNGAEAATLRIVSQTHVKAVVPADATTGPILVETAHGTLVSTRPFTVVPAAASPTGIEPTFAGPRPNPAIAPVTWRFALPDPGHARLTVFDLSGRRVRVVVDTDLPAGAQEHTWDGRDEHRARVPPGLYWARLEAAGRHLRRSLVLLR